MSRLVLFWPLTHEPWGYTIQRAVMEIHKVKKEYAYAENEEFFIHENTLFFACDTGAHLIYDRESDDPPAWVRDGLIWRPTRAA